MDQSIQRAARKLTTQLVADIGEKSEYQGSLPIIANLPKGGPEDGMNKMIQGIKDAVILMETSAPVEGATGVKAWLFEVESESRKPPTKAAVFNLTGSGSAIRISIP